MMKHFSTITKTLPQLPKDKQAFRDPWFLSGPEEQKETKIVWMALSFLPEHWSSQKKTRRQLPERGTAVTVAVAWGGFGVRAKKG